MGDLDTIGEERRFQLLVDAVTDYAIYLLDTEGRVASWNTGAQRIKGYEAREILGQSFSRFFTEPDRAAGVPQQALETARAEGRFAGEGWRVRKDGSLFFASVVIDAVHAEDGKLIGFAKVTRDITELLEAQSNLEAAQKHLAQSQKMEAVGQLTGGVAHDFNNLMMVISGQANALRRHIGDDTRAAQALDAIETAVARGVTLTRHLLTFSRRQRLTPTPVDLAAKIEDFRVMLSNSLTGSLQLRISLPDGLWPVAVDVGELQLAMLNIAVNARDAMPEGGCLRIDASNVRLERGDRGLELEGEFVALTFTDEGVGIPEDILAKVFEPFFTTKQADKGTGLGLSQVYGLANQSGGAVAIDSVLGEGSTVTLYLPKTENQPVEAEREEEGPTNSGGRILVVEDNPDVAAVSAALLEQLGYQVDVVGSAEAALRTLSGEEQFDLVLSDIVMAGAMNGIDLARRLRDEPIGVPVLLMSGYSRVADSAQTEFSILRKPYQITELGRMVGRTIAAGRAGLGRSRGPERGAAPNGN